MRTPNIQKMRTNERVYMWGGMPYIRSIYRAVQGLYVRVMFVIGTQMCVCALSLVRGSYVRFRLYFVAFFSPFCVTLSILYISYGYL